MQAPSTNALFYKPPHGTVGDVIPFYDNGTFKPFYLKGNLGYFGEDKSAGWTMLTTKDHLHFTEQPTGIRGGTGSVLQVDGTYHLFYCTFRQNPKRETICHAVSQDCSTWTTLEEENFTCDGTLYDLTDWRDPFVFWNEEKQQWWMLVAAKEMGETARRGCVGLCTSEDLHHWAYQPPFYAPHLHTSAHECPDLFQMGDWYYLIYSQYTDRFQTYYRMSKSLDGPWLAPEVDSFDTRCFYAAKTGTDGTNRYLYGWNPTRYYDNWKFNPPIYPGKDHNSFDWGDTMIVHQLVQRPDGTLAVTVPSAVDQGLSVKNELPLVPQVGAWTVTSDSASTDNPYGYSSLLFANRVPSLCKLELDITFDETVREVGVALQVDEEFGKGYYLSLQPFRHRLEFKSALRMYDEGGWTFPFDVEMERPIHLVPHQPYHLRIFVQDSILLAYLGEEIALSTRMFDYNHRFFGLFATEGQAKFEHIKLRT